MRNAIFPIKNLSQKSFLISKRILQRDTKENATRKKAAVFSSHSAALASYFLDISTFTISFPL
jgi:hypothetical protein